MKEKVQKEEKEVRAQTEEVKGIQADAQRDLDVAMPALEAAMKALQESPCSAPNSSIIARAAPAQNF